MSLILLVSLRSLRTCLCNRLAEETTGGSIQIPIFSAIPGVLRTVFPRLSAFPGNGPFERRNVQELGVQCSLNVPGADTHVALQRSKNYPS